MILKMFTVYDSKTEAYLPPIYHRSRGEALRAFEATTNMDDHQFNKYPADFTLFEIGEFDDSTCTIETLSAHINLGKALEFLKFQEPLPFDPEPVNHLTQKPHHEG